MKTKQQAIEAAKEIMNRNNMSFATIWKISNVYGFNFENFQIGYSVKEYGIKRTVIEIVK